MLTLSNTSAAVHRWPSFDKLDKKPDRPGFRVNATPSAKQQFEIQATLTTRVNITELLQALILGTVALMSVDRVFKIGPV